MYTVSFTCGHNTQCTVTIVCSQLGWINHNQNYLMEPTTVAHLVGLGRSAMTEWHTATQEPYTIR